MYKINIILDYKNRFESKYTAIPYRSGFDKRLLEKYFNQFGFEVTYITYPEIDFQNSDFNSSVFIYCSSEDKENYYKSYIEDVILGLKLAGAIVVPDYCYLRAQNNKLFMEILRNINENESIKKLHLKHFGTIEDLIKQRSSLKKISYVIKPAMGAMSKGISCASEYRKLLKNVKKISQTPSFYEDTKDILRRIRHKGYVPESRYRKKYVLQEMVMNLSGDWKILIFNKKYYVLRRNNRKPEDCYRITIGASATV